MTVSLIARKSVPTVAAVIAYALVYALPARAHHSTAEYDRTALIELEGEIIEAIWRNPHVGMTLRVTSDDGSRTDWRMEAADYTGTMRRGVPSRAFVEGDFVRVAGFASTRRAARMLVTNVLLPDDTEVLLVGRAEPLWSENFVGGGDWIIDAPDDGGPDPDGIFRVWTLESTVEPAFAADPPLTDAARAEHQQWDPLADPALQCAPIGLPRVMTRTGPHPIEFIDRGETIALRGEYFDIERTIVMSETVDAPAAPRGPLGYSVGRWDGDALIVETTNIDYPYFDIRGLEGVPQGRNVRMTEVFVLGDDQQTLTYSITVDDPTAFTEPVVANDYATWRWRPGVRVEPYRCVP